MSDGKVDIVRATLAEVDALVPLFDAYRQFYGQPPNPASAREFLVERLRGGESTVFLAGDEARAVGFVQLFPMFSSVALARTYVLNDLFVVPDVRRAGVGRALIAAAVEFCRDAGAARVSLSTAVTNDAARALYEATGWSKQTDYDVYVLRL